MFLTSSEKSSNELEQHVLTSRRDKGQMVETLYKSLTYCIKDTKKTYKEKIDELSTTWEMLASLKDQSSPVIRYLYRDTVMLVLQSEWGKLKKTTKSHLRITLQDAVANLFNTHACNLCQRALRVVTDPWNHPVVIKIINDLPISECEGREFFLTEMPILLTARLDRLCWDDKCKDLALKLVSFCRKSFQDSRCLLEPVCSVVCQQLWIDLHLTLVYICNERNDFSVMLERHFSEGYDIVNRLIRRTSESNGQSKENSGINRIWREFGMETADFASQCLLSAALIRCPPPNNLSPLAIQFVNLQKAIGKSNQDIINKLHKLIHNDRLKKITTSAHMYILGATLSDTFNDDFKPFGIELYVKAVAADLNVLESQKLNQDGDGIRIVEIGLAVSFSKLAEFLHANLRICREIALTAFSLHPTKERFDKLIQLVCEEVAKEKSESPARKECLGGIGEKNPEISSNLPQGDENQLPYSDSDATALGLSEAVIRDLASIVHSVRWDVLTWKNGWKELAPLCQRYMIDQENMRSVTKELLFLKVDYDQFKDMPRLERDVNWGIEKGYEKCLESTALLRKYPRCKGKLNRRPQLGAKIGLLARKKSLKSRSLSHARSKEKKMTKIKIRMHQASQEVISFVPEDSIHPKECKATPEVSRVAEGVKRSARIKTRKLRNAILPQEPSSLVKRLREIRLKPENMDEWRKLDLLTRTSHLAEVPKQCKQLYCSGSSDANATDHFAPMLSTLNMQPRIFLNRISMCSKKLLVERTDGKSYVTTDISSVYNRTNESDNDELNSAEEKVMTNKTNLKKLCPQASDRSTAGAIQLKTLTESISHERFRDFFAQIDNPIQKDNGGSSPQQVLHEQEEPISSTFHSLSSSRIDSSVATRGDIHSAPLTSCSNFPVSYQDPDLFLQSSSVFLSSPRASCQSEGKDCKAVLPLGPRDLASINPRIRKRSLSPPSSVCLNRPSLCTASHVSVNLSSVDEIQVNPSLLQPGSTLSKLCQTSEKLRWSPGKRSKLESHMPTNGTPVASTVDSTQLRKQERWWCQECGFPRSDGNRKESKSLNEPYSCAESSLPQESFDNQEHSTEDCKKIQSSNQVILAWIKWLQLEMNPNESPPGATVTECEMAQEKNNSSLVEDLHRLIVELCDKSEDSRAAQQRACDYLQSYCMAQQQSISSPQPSNDVSQLNSLDWFRLLIFEREALSRQTRKTCVNVLAFLISLLVEEQPILGILTRINEIRTQRCGL